MDTEKLLDIVNTFDKNSWITNGYRNNIFQEYIKEFLKELNDECKDAGWRRKEKLVRYETCRGNGKVFCLISPESRIILELGKFNLLEYIRKFEENKDMIRQEALKFVAEYPNRSKQFDSIIDEYIEFMKNRPYFIDKSKFTFAKKQLGHFVTVTIRYIDISNVIKFDIHKKPEDYPINKICRGQANGLASHVANAIIYSITNRYNYKYITQEEQDFAVKYVLKHQEIRTANKLIHSGKLSSQNVDKLNGLLMIATINNPEEEIMTWGSV